MYNNRLSDKWRFEHACSSSVKIDEAQERLYIYIYPLNKKYTYFFNYYYFLLILVITIGLQTNFGREKQQQNLYYIHSEMKWQVTH